MYTLTTMLAACPPFWSILRKGCQLDELRLDRAGGVGGMGDEGVLPDNDPGVAVEFLDGVLFILIEECGLAPRENDMFA